MTVLYPRERVKEVLQPLSLATAHRIVLKPYLSDPLTARRSKSRFCDGRTYAVLYAAGDFATAFAEVVVRDRLVQRDRRLVGIIFDEKAEAAISAGTSDPAMGFRHLIKSLPLAGYETNCDAVAKKLNIQGLSGARSMEPMRNHAAY